MKVEKKMDENSNPNEYVHACMQLPITRARRCYTSYNTTMRTQINNLITGIIFKEEHRNNT